MAAALENALAARQRRKSAAPLAHALAPAAAMLPAAARGTARAALRQRIMAAARGIAKKRSGIWWRGKKIMKAAAAIMAYQWRNNGENGENNGGKLVSAYA
jgi:hypothetical protein